MKPITVAVIGLGYVGLPLALNFGKHYITIGYDISTSKINSYTNQVDPSGEVSSQEFKDAKFFIPTNDPTLIKQATHIIIAMPTPVDSKNNPDFDPLIDASSLVGEHMSEGAIVIYESTVYPGATEEVCIPVLEDFSGLTWQIGFNVGYSPERISPGDKNRTLTKIVKIVSGDCQETLDNVASLYETIIDAGICKASSIRVAEAAKVVENIQRDVNIALMNELSTIFHRLGLDTNEVIDAASSKWNFVGYRPGLVGGHCIGVDPYYLINKAESVKHYAPLLNTARAVNNEMAPFIAYETAKLLGDLRDKSVAVFGLTFKEDCTDLRNSKVFDLIREYQEMGLTIYLHDPIVKDEDVYHEYGFRLTPFDAIPKCDIVVLGAPHKELLELPELTLIDKLVDGGIFVDIKGKMDRALIESENKKVWRL